MRNYKKKFYQIKLMKEKQKETEEARKYNKLTSEMIKEFNRSKASNK